MASVNGQRSDESLCKVEPPLSKQWGAFIHHLGKYWWGADMTRPMAGLLLETKDPGSAVAYAPGKDSSPGSVYSGSIVTKKFGVLGFDVVQATFDEFAVVLVLPFTRTESLYTTRHLIDTWRFVREEGTLMLAKEDVVVGHVDGLYRFKPVERPRVWVTRAGVSDTACDLGELMTSLNWRGVWWGVIPNAGRTSQDSKLKRVLKRYARGSDKRPGIACMLPPSKRRKNDQGCLFHVYELNKLVTVYLGGRGTGFRVTRGRKSTDVKPGSLQTFLENTLNIDFVPFDPLETTADGTSDSDENASDDAVLELMSHHINMKPDGNDKLMSI